VAHLACLLGNHAYDNDDWILRPAWVGAGISLEAVHFDRNCTRCRHLESVWAPVEGERAAQSEPLHLSEWLTRNGASVERPDGVIRLPEGGTF
jgi:hypothetical protein